MDKPRLFIASSNEAIPVVRAIKIELGSMCKISDWKNAFAPSSFTFATLESKANQADFAIFVFHPDDEVIIKDNNYSAVRDNVLLELGLFAGKLGIDRCFIVCPDKVSEKDLRIPTDLLGITYCFYDAKRLEEHPTEAVDAVGDACARIQIVISGHLAEQKNIEEPNDDVVFTKISKEHLNFLKGQVFMLTNELQDVQDSYRRLETSALEHLNSVVRPATETEVEKWLDGAKANYKNIETMPYRNTYYVNKDIVMPTLYGAKAINLIVESGTRVFGLSQKGHSTIYFMDGFTKSEP